MQAGQTSRAVDLVEEEGMLLWAMDSPDEVPYIYRCALEQTATEPERLFELPGPSYYAARNGAGGYYFGTTVEKGEAVKDDYGHIIANSPDGSWSDIHRACKDYFPQQGIFYFPRGTLPQNWLVFSQRALKPHEGCMTIASDRAWD